MTAITYQICRLIIKSFFKFLYNLHMEGIENIPKDGPFIIAANHSSFYDPPIIIASVRQKIYWVIAKDIYTKPILNVIFKFAGFVGVNGASNEALELLERKKILGIFPEGTRTRDGQLKIARSGTALLALKSGVTVIPCAIIGTFRVYPPHRIFPKLGNIRIIFGRPLSFDKITVEPVPKEILQSATDTIMDNIRNLLSR